MGAKVATGRPIESSETQGGDDMSTKERVIKSNDPATDWLRYVATAIACLFLMAMGL